MFGPFRLLRNRQYAVYFGGQLLSMTGTWMQAVVQGWLVYRLTHSGVWLGLVTFSGQASSFIVSPIAGVIADQADRRKVLIITYGFALVQALCLAALVYSGSVQVWQIAVLSAVLGVINAFDMTTRHAFAIDMVGRSELSSAITLNTILINASRVIGPAAAGVWIALMSEASSFVLNAASYIFVIVGLLMMKIPPRQRSFERNVLAKIREATRYVRGQPDISNMLALTLFIAFASFAHVVLLPVIAKDVLHGDSRTLGWLTAMNGTGAVVGALFSSKPDDLTLAKQRILKRILLMGIALVGLGVFAHTMATALISMFFVGYFLMSIWPTINNFIQQAVHDSMRGRVMSLYTMTFLAGAPVGSFAAGYLADRLGAPSVVAGSGVLCMVFAGVFAPSLRQPKIGWR